MDIEKIKDALVAAEVDEEKIAKILASLEEKEDESDKEKELPPEDGNPENDVPPSQNDEKDAANEEIPIPPQAVVEEGEGNPTQEEGEPQPPAEEDATVNPPVDEVTPQIPEQPPVTIDPQVLMAKMDEQAGIIKEQSATIEGLMSRVASLEQALQSAGVLDRTDSENEIGVDNSRVPPNGSEGARDVFDDALDMLNGKRYR